MVQQGWVVSQVNQGFPALNTMFPGGTDMTVLNELPSWDWSSLFRPHVWGYLLFGLNVGMAWHWWVPAFVLVSSCYLLAVTLLPRRPVTAALISIALFFTPFLQWWYGPSTLFSVAWPLLAMAAVVWVLVDTRRWVRIVWSVATGYFAVTLAMGLYVPYIIPGLLVFLTFSVGFLFRVRPWAVGGARAAWGRLTPLIASGLAAIVITAVWALTRIATFDAIQSTVYPGQRLAATGGVLVGDPYLAGIGGAPWNQALKAIPGGSLLGLNSSESSSVILLSLFVLPGLIWFAVRSFGSKHRVDWLLVSAVLLFALIAAYLLVPGWDAVAHVLQLDRVPAERFRVVFVVLLPLFAILVVDHVDRAETKRAWIVGLCCSVFAAVIIFALWSRIRSLNPEILGLAPTWKIIAVLLVLMTLLLFIKRGVVAAAAMLLVASVLMGWGVNPIYQGVFDLSKTDTGEAILKADKAETGVWIGIGSYETMAILVESGVSSLSGVQNYPTEQMWDEIDPTSKYENEWNRLGQVQWSLGTGALKIANPQANLIAVTVDPCSSFAQDEVSYILADSPVSAELDCVLEKSTIQQGQVEMRIYEIVPAGRG
ncbi:hypothetical protein GY21_17055 [Cryobacterium roopkundense]|uniref:Glycosyltransferase RgtA/B/C/D-like domain-containing protein n=1 Tax=Cryobacterium roopkundense TaxID=1001240 RepID=A0A099J2C2_9MICO|nr:hypothetical protein GY21_17055 [Cryobacterium roopkundense]